MADAWLPVFLVTLVLVCAGVLAMAVGVIFRRPCLRGSCGGVGSRTSTGKSLDCSTCPNRKRARAASDD